MKADNTERAVLKSLAFLWQEAEDRADALAAELDAVKKERDDARATLLYGGTQEEGDG